MPDKLKEAADKLASMIDPPTACTEIYIGCLEVLRVVIEEAKREMAEDGWECYGKHAGGKDWSGDND